MPMTTGNTAVTTSSSRFRRRRKTSRSSDRNSRPQARTLLAGTPVPVRSAGTSGAGRDWGADPGAPAGSGVGAMAGVGAGAPAGSGADIEAFAGQAHEQVFQAGR